MDRVREGNRGRSEKTHRLDERHEGGRDGTLDQCREKKGEGDGEAVSKLAK